MGPDSSRIFSFGCPERPIHLLIVEDVDSMRALLEHVIQEIPGIQLTPSARNCAEARLELMRNRPDLVLLDEVLPGESSGDLLVDLTQQQVRVLLLTSMEEQTHEIPPGALGRLRKPGWRSVEQDREYFLYEIHQAMGRVLD